MSISASALRRRRHANPLREARRQAHLTRMLRRIVDYVPVYRDRYDGRGDVIASTYLGHRARYYLRWNA